MTISEHKFIFIAGLHRSGTTLLFQILRSHPLVSGFDFLHGAEREHEGQNLQSVYAPDPELGGAGYFAFNDEAHLTEDSTLVTEANRKKLFKEWGTHWDLSRPYLMEKSPPNLVRTRFLQALFPNSYFVVILRHPITTSLATLKWMGWPRFVVAPNNDKKSAMGLGYTVRDSSSEDIKRFRQSNRLFTESIIYTLLKHWTTAHEIFYADSVNLKRTIIIRYEDLVVNPRACLASVYKFLSIPNEEQLLTCITNRNLDYLNQWTSYSPSVFSKDARQFFNKVFGDKLHTYKYSLSEPWCW